MMQDFEEAEEAAVLSVAQKMCAAARTAPKTKGQDLIETCILTGKEKDALADEMERLADPFHYGFFHRDAGNVRQSQAVVLIGVQNQVRGLNDGCRYCNFANCGDCTERHGVCVYGPIDLGIAIGAAVGVAADARIDNRVMFSVGRAALSLGILDKEAKTIMGIPLSVSGKSPYFDRK